MPADTFTTLLLGDVYSDLGIRVLFFRLKELIRRYHADFVIVNGENACNGFGLSVDNMNRLFGMGVDVITSGNHIWEQEEILPYLDSEARLLRPANYASSVPGHGSVIHKGVGVINIQGRQNMPVTDDPFRCCSDQIRKMKGKTNLIFVDMHAESGEEKEAMACHIDGSVSCLVGTHIHVQTADEKILEKGTAYITDLGMCGPKNSCIGSDIALAVRRQKTQMPLKAVPAEGEGMINGVCVVCDRETGKALSIQRINE